VSFEAASGSGVFVPVPCSAGASAIGSMSPVSLNVRLQGRDGFFQPSATSGKAAICLPNVPRLAIKRPTSAALSVVYFKLVPDIGSNVLSVKAAFDVAAVSVFADSVSSSAALRLRDLASLSGWIMLYFVVIRV
jgi:hypothetical protein